MSTVTPSRASVYELVTDRILKLLETGAVPWRKPWSASAGFPRSLASGKTYRGINVFTLSAASYESLYWLTFKQAQARGGNVRKGEHGFPVVFWRWPDRDDETDAGEADAPKLSRRGPLLRYYTVFNVAQCEGIQYPLTVAAPRTHTPIESCERILAGMPDRPAVDHGSARACYSRGLDRVSMPHPPAFVSGEAYYATLFHELAHATGHERRLDRDTLTASKSFGDANYSREELVAEMGAAYLCGEAGIDCATIDNAASYLAGWIQALRGDARLVVIAAAQAQKAADYALNRFAETAPVAQAVAA